MSGPVSDRNFPAMGLRILAGCDSGLLTEAAAEIIFIGKAYHPGDFTQGFSGFQQMCLRMADAQFGQVIERTLAGQLLKNRRVLPERDIGPFRQLLHGDAVHIVVLQILDRTCY
ncbi:hypothetical protein D3C74_382320 [compost metagenome]